MRRSHRVSALLALVSCAPPAPPSMPTLDVTVTRTQAHPFEVTSSDAPEAAIEEIEENGWALKGRGRFVEATPRSSALAKVKETATRVIVEAGPVFHECSGAGGMHAYFSVHEEWGDEPFDAAVLGGHGVWGLPEEPGRLYVAGVRLRERIDPAPNPGWCLDSLPASDADVVALVPVRSFAEGLRLLERMR